MFPAWSWLCELQAGHLAAKLSPMFHYLDSADVRRPILVIRCWNDASSGGRLTAVMSEIGRRGLAYIHSTVRVAWGREDHSSFQAYDRVRRVALFSAPKCSQT